MDPQTIVDFAELCGMTLGHAHACSGDFCQIAGYLGKGARFDTAITEFAEAYADQVERDHALLEKAVCAGRIAVEHAAPAGRLSGHDDRVHSPSANCGTAAWRPATALHG